MKILSFRAAGLLALPLACALAVPVHADNFPSRPVTIVVPFPPGGTADILPRIVADKLRERWGQAVIVENKPGAAGTSGSTSVANAAPDGYVLLSSPAGPLVINKLVQKAFSFDPLDLAPIAKRAQVRLEQRRRPLLPKARQGAIAIAAHEAPGSLVPRRSLVEVEDTPTLRPEILAIAEMDFP